jgi:hypothetical protein
VRKLSKEKAPEREVTSPEFPDALMLATIRPCPQVEFYTSSNLGRLHPQLGMTDPYEDEAPESRHPTGRYHREVQVATRRWVLVNNRVLSVAADSIVPRSGPAVDDYVIGLRSSSAFKSACHGDSLPSDLPLAFLHRFKAPESPLVLRVRC